MYLPLPTFFFQGTLFFTDSFGSLNTWLLIILCTSSTKFGEEQTTLQIMFNTFDIKQSYFQRVMIAIATWKKIIDTKNKNVETLGKISKVANEIFQAEMSSS